MNQNQSGENHFQETLAQLECARTEIDRLQDINESNTYDTKINFEHLTKEIKESQEKNAILQKELTHFKRIYTEAETENAALKSERDEYKSESVAAFQSLIELRINYDVALRALEIACRVIRNKWFPMDSVQCITDRYIQQAKSVQLKSDMIHTMREVGKKAKENF